MFHLTLLNATALIPNHLRFVTKLLGRAVRNRLFSFCQCLIKAAGAIWVEFPVMMGFQGAPYITAYLWSQTRPLIMPPQAAQTGWKSLPNINCLVAQLPVIHIRPWLQTFVLLNGKTIVILCLLHWCTEKKLFCLKIATSWVNYKNNCFTVNIFAVKNCYICIYSRTNPGSLVILGYTGVLDYV